MGFNRRNLGISAALILAMGFVAPLLAATQPFSPPGLQEVHKPGLSAPRGGLKFKRFTPVKKYVHGRHAPYYRYDEHGKGLLAEKFANGDGVETSGQGPKFILRF